MALYHVEIGIPSDVELPRGSIALRYSPHALDAARRDRYGDFTPALPGKLNLRLAKLIEVEVDDRDAFPAKIVYRYPIGNGFDLVLAIMPDGGSLSRWLVKTVWANKSSDNHKTLRREAYASVA